MSVLNSNEPREGDRLLVGVDELAAEINQPTRRIFHWLACGRIKSAQKVGAYWTASRRKLRAEFGLED